MLSRCQRLDGKPSNFFICTFTQSTFLEYKSLNSFQRPQLSFVIAL